MKQAFNNRVEGSIADLKAETDDVDSAKREDPSQKAMFGFPRKARPGNSSGNEERFNDSSISLFSAQSVKGSKQTKKGQDDIALYEVIVPYQRLETERFHFWPPSYPVLPTDHIETEGKADLKSKKDA